MGTPSAVRAPGTTKADRDNAPSAPESRAQPNSGDRIGSATAQSWRRAAASVQAESKTDTASGGATYVSQARELYVDAETKALWSVVRRPLTVRARGPLCTSITRCAALCRAARDTASASDTQQGPVCCGGTSSTAWPCVQCGEWFPRMRRAWGVGRCHALGDMRLCPARMHMPRYHPCRGTSFLPLTRRRHMQVRGVTPKSQWPEVARTLAQLQSIIRVQTSQDADLAVAALALANSATVLPPDDTVASGGSGSSSDYDDAIAASPVGTSTIDLDTDDEQCADDDGARNAASPGAGAAEQRAMLEDRRQPSDAATRLEDRAEHVVPAAATARPGGRSRAGGGASRSQTSEATGTAGARATAASGAGARAGGAAGPAAEGQEDVRERLQWFSWRVAHGPLSHQEAQLLDALFMQQVMGLACQAHYGGAPHAVLCCAADVCDGSGAYH